MTKNKYRKAVKRKWIAPLIKAIPENTLAYEEGYRFARFETNECGIEVSIAGWSWEFICDIVGDEDLFDQWQTQLERIRN